MDPSLVFGCSVVPVTDGLPDVSKVPKLLLPMGWRQVTWSGLLPVVFDPYRQAFKLTPVGPMPLTSEELHQGGLQKYVPGGAAHPESAHLPQMMDYSDGSDAEVYNWEGVDWVLPWPKNENFFSSTYNTPNTRSAGSNATIALIKIKATIWSEGRDCPNKIFDLADAWRWLADREREPSTDFVPSPKKHWRGTGAYRSARKTKSPIPELMMGAKYAEQDDANPILQNQDAREPRKNNEFCPFKSVATPSHVDITLLADTEFTLMEMLCYFPQHFHWGHAAERLARAGVQASHVKDLINMTRGLEGETSLRTSIVSYAMKMAKARDLVISVEQEEGGETASTPSVRDGPATTSYTAEDWVYDVWTKIDYPLLALAHGLLELPQGVDAGPVTILIKWCRENARYETLLSEVPTLLKEANIEPLIEPSEDGYPDRELVPRYADAIKKDCKRVRMSAKDVKRAVEDDDTEVAKKKKKTG